MANTFVEFTKPTMMPGGGVAATGENVGFDAVTAGNFIAQGVAASGSAPGAFVPLPTQRVKFTGLTGSVMVNGVPPLFNPGEIATFLAPISAQLIAAGLAVSN
jgi:hypothetical protein